MPTFKEFVCYIIGMIIATPFWPEANSDYEAALGYLLTATVIATILIVVAGMKRGERNEKRFY